MSQKVFNSSYDLLDHFCSRGSVEIRFYQKFSSHLYPEFNFGYKELHEALHVPIWMWFTEGDGIMPWTGVSLVFSNTHGELEFKFKDANLDEEYSDWDEQIDEYLLNVKNLKDGRRYMLQDE